MPTQLKINLLLKNTLKISPVILLVGHGEENLLKITIKQLKTPNL